jgi:predicted nucleotidyltransferase
MCQLILRQETIYVVNFEKQLHRRFRWTRGKTKIENIRKDRSKLIIRDDKLRIDLLKNIFLEEYPKTRRHLKRT